jgi:hypothetical protein
MDAGSDEIPRRPLVEVATTGAVLGDRAEGGPPPLFPCSSPSAKSRWAASNKGGEGVGCAGGARRGHDGMGLLHLLLCRLTSSATMCLPHCSYHGSWCPFISGASAWRRAVACPPLSRVAAASPASGHRSSRPWPSAVEWSWPCPVPLGREEEELTDM